MIDLASSIILSIWVAAIVVLFGFYLWAIKRWW